MRTLTFLASLAVASPLLAQPGQQPPNQPPPRQEIGGQNAPVIAQAPRVEPKTFKLDFAGGSIESLAAAMEKVEGVSFSIVTAENQDLKVELPRIRIVNGTAHSLADVLRHVMNARGFGLETVRTGDVNTVICVVHQHGFRPPAASIPQLFESFQLGPFLERGATVEHITDAIQMSWKLNPANQPDGLRLKFHPGTSILLVSGSHEALEVARKILTQLPAPNSNKNENKR